MAVVMVAGGKRTGRGKLGPVVVAIAVPVNKTLLQGMMFFLDTQHVA
jgi:hypothetical protein